MIFYKLFVVYVQLCGQFCIQVCGQLGKWEDPGKEICDSYKED